MVIIIIIFINRASYRMSTRTILGEGRQREEGHFVDTFEDMEYRVGGGIHTD